MALCNQLSPAPCDAQKRTGDVSRVYLSSNPNHIQLVKNWDENFEELGHDNRGREK